MRKKKLSIIGQIMFADGQVFVANYSPFQQVAKSLPSVTQSP